MLCSEQRTTNSEQFTRVLEKNSFACFAEWEGAGVKLGNVDGFEGREISTLGYRRKTGVLLNYIT